MLVRVPLCVLVSAFVLAMALGQTDHSRVTTTTLNVQQGGTYSSTGIVVLLSATVTSGSSAVTRGLVKFCDASTSRCAGASALGSAQLDAHGVAAIRVRLGPGKHSLKAIFWGTPHSSPPESASSSTVQTTTIQQDSVSPGGGELR